MGQITKHIDTTSFLDRLARLGELPRYYSGISFEEGRAARIEAATRLLRVSQVTGALTPLSRTEFVNQLAYEQVVAERSLHTRLAESTALIEHDLQCLKFVARYILSFGKNVRCGEQWPKPPATDLRDGLSNNSLVHLPNGIGKLLLAMESLTADGLIEEVDGNYHPTNGLVEWVYQQF